MQEGLADARRTLDASGRMAQAVQAKEQANAHFQAGKWRVAIVGYLAGVYLVGNQILDGRVPKPVSSRTPDVVETALYVDNYAGVGAAPRAFLV